ncbi:hypothetical protein [Hymenobacter psoromatis]|uniref:hypothetical protein n=1 Tax=Hymenobacter psoromatis TaxID=1484116 RepID=UPI001CBEAE8A|nr:hypothetical protein [Hymenobacter psoromatis]
MSASTSIGQRFTELIHHLGMSKNAFAQSLDKTATVIQHLVDERNKPGFDLLCKVFETYPNVSKDWLLLGQGGMLTYEAVSPPTPAPLLNAASARAPAAPVADAPAGQEPALPPAAPPAPAAALDLAYLTAALQTQYLQHQLALAEQRNQHLLEQQQLMRQLVQALERNS